MTQQNQVDTLIAWLSTYNPAALHNEAEVESKFVEPFFRLLGYPEDCRRPKFPLSTYNPNRAGRKPEPDQVYFSSDDIQHHTADTTLLIVEAKEPTDDDLDEAIRQALFYAFHLKPPFVCATNGHQLRILKWRVGSSDETIFDDSISKLNDRTEAIRLHAGLNFEIVKHLKEQMKNPLTHGQYVEVAQALRYYPDLQEVLSAGDFKTSLYSEGNTLYVSEPKVRVRCLLPDAFGKGTATVEFSNALRSALVTHLSHEDIVKNFLLGLQTRLEQEARPYLRPTVGGFSVELGQVTTVLSMQETEDLCACIDQVCEAYKGQMILTEETLQTWDYKRVPVDGMQGFRILSVRHWLWSLMKSFASEFDNFERKTQWHIFEPHTIAIRIARDATDNANLYPRYDNDLMPPAIPSHVDVIYAIPSYSFKPGPPENPSHWSQAVGARGIWTAGYTRNWVLNEFIPEVLRRYPKEAQRHGFNSYTIIDHGQERAARVPLTQIEEPRQLYDYLHDVQSWLSINPKNIKAALLLPYYEMLTDLLRGVEPARVNVEYIARNLSMQGGFVSQITVADIFLELHRRAAQVKAQGFDLPGRAERVSRVFMDLVHTDNIGYSQAQLNSAVSALRPLWEERSFEMRYVMPERWAS
jgi:hypothetical protein